MLVGRLSLIMLQFGWRFVCECGGEEDWGSFLIVLCWEWLKNCKNALQYDRVIYSSGNLWV